MILTLASSSLAVMLFFMKIDFLFWFILHPILPLRHFCQRYFLNLLTHNLPAHYLLLLPHQRHIILIFHLHHHKHTPPSSPSISHSSQLSHSSSHLNTLALILLRSDQPRQPSIILRDFHCGKAGISSYATTTGKPSSSQPSTKYPLTNFISYKSLSHSHKLFVNTISSTIEPTTYEQAIQCLKWCEVIEDELTALANQKTWSLVSLPSGHRSIGTKWVFQIKYESDGTVERYKAHLVAKGFTQKEGLDYMRLLLWLLS